MRGGDQGLRSDDEQKRVCENTDRGRLKTIVLRCLSLVLSLEMFFFFYDRDAFRTTCKVK